MNHPILDHYEHEIIQISSYSSNVLLKGAPSSRLLICFKYNNPIQDKKLVLKKRKNGLDDNSIKRWMWQPIK